MIPHSKYASLPNLKNVKDTWSQIEFYNKNIQHSGSSYTATLRERSSNFERDNLRESVNKLTTVVEKLVTVTYHNNQNPVTENELITVGDDEEISLEETNPPVDKVKSNKISERKKEPIVYQSRY